MQSELDTIAAKLEGDDGPKDYVVWLHQQEESRRAPGETHCSIFDPDEISEADEGYQGLFELVCQRVAEIEDSLSS